MSKSLAMMPWFPRDFIAATRHLTLAERGAYRELLDYQWELGVLPNDETRLARLLGVTPDEFLPIWSTLKDKFEVLGTGLANKRLEEHRKKAVDGREKKIAAAAATNAKRYGERTNGHSLSISLSEPLSASPPTPTPTPTSEVRGEPRKDSRRAASGEPESLDKALFAEAREVFGRSIGGVINKAIRDRGKPFVVEMIELCRTKDPEAAKAYLIGAMKKSGGDPYAHAI